jgi:membrane protein DedA with SNARE-associated domain
MLNISSLWHTSVSSFEAALQGMGSVWLIGLALALTTLLLEDLAIAAGVALATQGSISWEWALLSVGGGIAIGDLGLYWLGNGARRVQWLRQRYIGSKSLWIEQHLQRRLSSAVLVARVIPGLRFVTYTACGFFSVPLLGFTLWVLLAVTLWTVGLFGLSVAIGQALATYLGIAPAIAVALPMIGLALAIPLWRQLRHHLNKASL